MKHMFVAFMFTVLCNMSAFAVDRHYQHLCANLSKVGDYIESIDNVPVIGKLTNLLPFAIVAAGLKECPLQTALALVGIFAYLASQNRIIRSNLQKCRAMSCWATKKKSGSITEDELLFVFDGDDEDTVLLL